MNFNYSYRAFLITSLLFASFFLLMYSLKLPGAKLTEEPSYDVEYSEADDSEEPELNQLNNISKVETNRAYNEAEAYLNESRKADPKFQQTLDKMDEALDRSKEETKSDNPVLDPEILPKVNPAEEMGELASRNTTITYKLEGRRAISLRNPVFTCNAYGTVVISIKVNALGKVTKATYDKEQSTSGNGCLIDSALEYALRSRFTTRAASKEQLGSITYNFPGQKQ